MTGNPHLQAHLQFAQANAGPKIAKELVSLLSEKNYFLKFPSLLKFFKTATAQPTQKTAKPTTDKDLTTQWTKRQHLTAVWRNGGRRGKLNSSNSNKHLCLVDSFVLRKPPLRQAASRYGQA